MSVIIPTHDRLHYLKKAVGSVLAQTFGKWELLVVDDGSTDGTAEWLETLDDPRVLCVSLDRHTGNAAHVRNRGIRVATGRFIAFLDSDDLWSERKLEIQTAALRASPGCRWSYTDYALIGERDEEIDRRDDPGVRSEEPHLLLALMQDRAAAPIQTLLCETSLLHEVGLLDEAFTLRQDYDLALRLAARAGALYVPESLTLIRDHPGRTTSHRHDHHRWAAAVYEKSHGLSTDAAVVRTCWAQSTHHRMAAVRSDLIHAEFGHAFRDLLLAFRSALRWLGARLAG